MSNIHKTCASCGASMTQSGSLENAVFYHCSTCGNDETVTLTTDGHIEYRRQRNELLGRVSIGIDKWQSTDWKKLRDEIATFRANNEAAQNDIYFFIARMACITKGFHNLDNQQYKECKQLFKITERVYKRYRKDPERATHFESETGHDGMVNYEKYRILYKTCRREYRNEKLAWKALFFLARRFIPVPKL